MIVGIGVAVAGFSVVLGSATGTRTTTPTVPALVLNAGSVSASRTIGADAIALRPDTTYELISSKTRTDPASTEVTSSKTVTVLARVKTDSDGEFSIRFVVPLTWRHDHLIELRKVKGADLVEQIPDWLTVTRPVPALALGADTIHAGSPAQVVVSGIRARTRYEVLSGIYREYAGGPGGGGSDPETLGYFRTDVNGRALVTFAVPDAWRYDHLIQIKKKKGRTHRVKGAKAWLTVVR